MELDFTKLNNIIEQSRSEEKIPTETKIECIERLQRRADQNQEETERARQVYIIYQENVKTNSQLQTEILKGIKAGEDIYTYAILKGYSRNISYNSSEEQRETCLMNSFLRTFIVIRISV